MAEAEARFLELKGSREYSASNTTGNVTIPVVCKKAFLPSGGTQT